MFSDPQSVTYSTVSKSLPAVGRSADGSDYKGVFIDAEYSLRVAHTFKARNRTVARLQRTATVTDPLVPANSIVVSGTATFTLDFPSAGMTLAQAQALGSALRDWLTDANILKMVGGET